MAENDELLDYEEEQDEANNEQAKVAVAATNDTAKKNVKVSRYLIFGV